MEKRTKFRILIVVSISCMQDQITTWNGLGFEADTSTNNV